MTLQAKKISSSVTTSWFEKFVTMPPGIIGQLNIITHQELSEINSFGSLYVKVGKISYTAIKSKQL